jgi:tetratricopeptide (TPR) repeat protein
MNELIIRYCHEDTPSCQVSYRSNIAMQETERFSFAFSISKEDRGRIQKYLEEYRTYPYGAFYDRAKKTEKLMFDTGTALFDEIFHNKEDKTHAAIRFYDRAMGNPATCHIIIQSDHVTGWSLPWEFLRDPAYGYLAQKVAGFVRSQPGVHLRIQPIRIEDASKINILMVVSRPDGEEEKVPFQSMARPLLEIFRLHKGRIHVDLLRPPTFEKLQQVLSEKPDFYHILHFDGHGAFSQSTRDNYNAFLSEEEFPGKLVFRKLGGGPDLVSGAKLGQLLSGKGVPIVILNACQSGMTDPDALYPSVGGELIKTGALGVVAMAYSVYVDTAVEFMKRVYESLINGTTLSRAVTIAREAMALNNQRESPIGPISLQDWVVPVLFQSGEVRLFPSSVKKLKLDPSITKGKPTDAGTEIDLPGEPDYGFIGRDRDILKLEESFENETIVLLQAMAGVGKSTTAVGFARWWEDTGALEGPIFFFSFENYTTFMQICDRIGGVFREIIKAQLNIEWHLLDTAQRCRLAIDILRKLPCLLIWDNFEPVAGFPRGTPSNWKKEEQEELKEFLKDLNGGATKILLTSRIDERWLGRCYKLVELQGLNSLDSMKLAGKVLDRAGINRRKIKPYHKLLKYLQGNPLAIQVILPELAHLEPEALLTQLQKGEAELSGDNKKQGREHSLAASLSYRLDKLDKSLRSRLGLLGLFQGFVNAGTLALICEDKEAPELLQGLKQDDWVKMLEQASEMGLLQKVGTDSYRIHPALPWFFHEILHTVYKKELDWLEKRFVLGCGYISHILKEMLRTDAEKGMILLHLQEQNLRYSLRLGVNFKMWDFVGYIFVTMTEMLERESRLSESEFLTNQIKEKATDSNDHPHSDTEDLCVSLWYNLGTITYRQRHFDEAEKWYQKSLDLSKKLKDEYGQANTYHALGIIAFEQRHFDEAKKWYQKSLEIKEKLKNEYGQLSTYHELGIIAQEQRHFDEAKKWYQKSLDLSKKLKDEYGQASTYHELGRIAFEQRHFDEAKKRYQKSLEIKEKLKNEYGQANTYHQLGINAHEQRHFDEAEKWYQKSLDLSNKLKNEYLQAITCYELGINAHEQRHFDEAEKWYQKSLDLSKKLKDEYGQAKTLCNLGVIQFGSNRPGETPV